MASQTINKVSFVLLALITSCTYHSDEGSMLDIDCIVLKNKIIDSFKANDSRVFTGTDSCLFVNYIIQDFTVPDQDQALYVFNKWQVFTNRCSYTKFSFNLIRDQKDSVLYYGHPDVYYLKYAKLTDSVYSFPNQPLENLLNHLLIKELVGSFSKNIALVKRLVFNLYFENTFSGIDMPLFYQALDVHHFYSENVSEQTLNEVRKRFEERNGNTVIFENFELGIFIFVFDVSDTSHISVKEFLVPSKNAIRFFRTDFLPDNYMLCKGLN